MVVNEDDVINIMGGMENAGGIKLNDHKRKLKNRFEICRKLGQGTYGKVQLGINKETSQQVAIKTIKKSKIETEADLIRIRREIQIMSSVQHPNIIHIYEVFENKEKMVLVMEIAAGGELYDYLSDRKCLEEHEARRIFRQIATAVYYCHKNNICHRDLKLENILLDENGSAKIADFGLSNVYDGKNLLNTFCGSPLYASPEIVRGSPYAGPEVDCWSLGVLLYTLVYGAMPFDGSNFKRLVKQITTGDYYEPRQPSSASSLVRTMLTVSSENRANIGDICSHWWVNEGYPQSCLEEAEYLASLTPVRLDLLLSLAPGSKGDDAVASIGAAASAGPTPVPKEGSDEVMSIVELPPGEPVSGTDATSISIMEPPEEGLSSPAVKRRGEKEKIKRKLTETPSMLDPDLVHKKRDVPASATPVPMETTTCDNGVVDERPKQEKSGKAGGSKSPATAGMERTPKSSRRKKEQAETEPQQTKPPKPKMRSSDEESAVEARPQVKRKVVRKDRNARNTEGTSQLDNNNDETVSRFTPADRPMTPRQARAPSPEERPLIVPLPSPRVQDLPLPPPRPQEPTLKSSKAVGEQPPARPPALPPRPTSVIVEPTAPPEVPPRQESLLHTSQEMHMLKDVPVKKTDVGKPAEILSPGNKEEATKETSEIMVENKVTGLVVRRNSNNKKPDQQLSPVIIQQAPSASVQQPSLGPVKAPQVALVHVEPPPPPVAAAEKPVQLKTGKATPKLEQANVLSVTASKEEDKPQQFVLQPTPTATAKVTVAQEFQQHKVTVQQQMTKVVPQAVQEIKIPEESVQAHPVPKNVPSKISPEDVVINEPQPEKTSLQQKSQAVKANSKEKADIIVTPKAGNSVPHLSRPNEEVTKGAVVNSVKHEAAGAIQAAGQLTRKLSPRNSQAVGQSPILLQQPPAAADVKANSGVAGQAGQILTRNQDKPRDTTLTDVPPNKVEDTQPKTTTPVQAKHAIPNASQPIAIPQKVSPVAGVGEERGSPASGPLVVPFPGKPDSGQPNNTPPSKKDEAGRSLINSLPKPFKAQQQQPLPTGCSDKSSPPVHSTFQNLQQHPLCKEATFESVASAVSLSSSNASSSANVPGLTNHIEDHIPLQVSSSGSPPTSSTSLQPQRPPSVTTVADKRDSKVIKAAQYWNHIIGEVLVKNKPPENPKSLEKPKKIISAGVGPKGYNDLKSAFELHVKPAKPEEVVVTGVAGLGGGMQRRNSKKISIEGCTPGLKVTDARSVFEMKNQQPTTPVIYRRNASVSGESKVANRFNFNKEDDEQPNKGATIKKKVAEFPPPQNKSIVSSRKKGVTDGTPDKLSLKVNNNMPSGINQPMVNGSEVIPVVVEGKPLSKPTNTNDLAVNGSVGPTSSKEMNGLDSSGKLTQQQKKVPPPTSPKPTLTKEELQAKEKAKVEPEQSNKNVCKVVKGSAEEGLVMVAPINKSQTAKVEPKPTSSEDTTTLAAVGVISREVFKTDSKPKAKNVVGTKPIEKATSSIKTITVSVEDNRPPSKPSNEKVTGEGEPQTQLEAVKNSLKKVPHAPAMGKKANEDVKEEVGLEKQEKGEEKPISIPVSQAPLVKPHVPQVPSSSMAKASTTAPVTPSTTVVTSKVEPVVSAPMKEIPVHRVTSPVQGKTTTKTTKYPDSEKSSTTSSTSSLRIIPIQIEQQSTPTSSPPPVVTSPTPSSSQSSSSHYIPIHVEGRGTLVNTPDLSREDQAEALDSFHTNSLSRRRWGSRKKRMSSAYSDSSGVSDEDASSMMGTNFSGLQKYTSIGKHGLEPMFRLRKTRPPFAAQRSDSFSSGEDDDFDDDGFREMTAENLFSTLLTRVKSLTRRINDEHDSSDAQMLRWQQNQHIVNHRLNPGGTHARLERTALRNSLKKNSGSSTPATSLSRQSSLEASRHSMRDDGTSSLHSYSGNGSKDDTASFRSLGDHSGQRSSMHRGPRASTISSQSIVSSSSSPSANKHQQQQQPRKATAMQQYRKISSEMQNAEAEILHRLRREAAERSHDLSELSDGFVSPVDSESMSSDTFFTNNNNNNNDTDTTASERRRQRSYLMRLDENSAMDHGATSSSARPVTRRSISKELFEAPSSSATSSNNRPGNRRSASRELFDVQFTPAWAPQALSDYPRASSRERSLGRDLDDLMESTRNLSMADRRSLHQHSNRRSESLSRPSLASQGRSLTQNDFGGASSSTASGSLTAARRKTSGIRSPLTIQTSADDDALVSRATGYNRYSTLEDRSRADWRRISVPERGNDYKSLSRKYNRIDNMAKKSY